MAKASVGRSRYGDLRGTEQFIEATAARQVNLLLDFVATLPGCYRPTVNEGNRSRARQLKLWNEYRAGRGALAAVPYTSTHDEVVANNAVDLGGPNGEALSGPVLAALRKYGPAYGVFPTGMGFSRPESWHYNAYPARAVITSAGTKPTPIPLPPAKETDMAIQSLFIIRTNANSAPGVVDTWLVSPETFSYSHLADQKAIDFWTKLGAVQVEGPQGHSTISGFTPVNTPGVR